MFLRNYYNIMARANVGFGYGVGSGFGNGSLAVKDTYGNIRTAGSGNPEYRGGSLPSLGDIDRISQSYDSYWSSSIVLGTGNEPVTFNDYILGTLISGPLSYSFVNRENSYNSDENKYYGKNKFTLSNTSNNDIVIREFGITGRFYYGNSSSNYTDILLFRELIEPYTLKGSESVNLFLNYSYTMPTIDESGNVVAGSQAYGLSIE